MRIIKTTTSTIKHVQVVPQRTPEELEAEIKSLVGTEKADLLLGKKSIDDLVQKKSIAAREGICCKLSYSR